GDTVDVRGLPHHPPRIGAHIPHADVVAEDDEDVGLLLGECWSRCQRQSGSEQHAVPQYSCETHIDLLILVSYRQSRAAPWSGNSPLSRGKKLFAANFNGGFPLGLGGSSGGEMTVL